MSWVTSYAWDCTCGRDSGITFAELETAAREAGRHADENPGCTPSTVAVHDEVHDWLEGDEGDYDEDTSDLAYEGGWAE